MPRRIGIQSEGKSAAGMIDAAVFYSLLGVIFLASIPYGSVELWWKAFFQCLIFLLAGLSLAGQMLAGRTPHPIGKLKDSVMLPALALIILALIQAIPWSSTSLPVVGRVGQTLSVDAFQTRLFAVHLAALVLVGWMLLVHISTQRRLRLLIQIIIAIGVLSAIFGMWRQASQREVGFMLPYLRPAMGYAQFINSNHFAFLMEMALGLALGIVVCRGVSGKQLVIHLTAAVPMWIALVLANSRGGILSLLCQVIFLALLLGGDGEKSDGIETSRTGGSERRSRRRENRVLQASRMLAVRGVLIAALLAGAVTTMVFVGGDPLAGRLETVPLELDQRRADESTLRQSIWRATWEMIKDHPITGVGFGGYPIAIPKYHRASGETTPQEAHNDYLELVASGGLLGLAVGVWFVLRFLKAARRQLAISRPTPFVRAAKLGALTGILTVGIHSLVDFGLHIPINAIVFTALISIVLINVEEDEAATRS